MVYCHLYAADAPTATKALSVLLVYINPLLVLLVYNSPVTGSAGIHNAPYWLLVHLEGIGDLSFLTHGALGFVFLSLSHDLSGQMLKKKKKKKDPSF